MTERSHGSGKRLSQALEVLERSLEAPVVPGESERQIEDVRSAVEEAHDAFAEHARREHSRSFREIGDADPALLHRVERMKEQDASLVDDWEDAVAGAHALSDAANAQPWNEEVFREGFDCYVLETLDLVLRTRTQEAAVRTWTGEAFHRDRGGGD